MAWCLNLKVGDWSAKIWSEDITESCLIWVFQHLTAYNYITSTSNIPHHIICSSLDHDWQIYSQVPQPTVSVGTWGSIYSLSMSSRALWRWTLGVSSWPTAAGVQLGLHSSSPPGWMVNPLPPTPEPTLWNVSTMPHCVCYTGFMEAWDVIETQHSPIMTVKVQEGPLHCLSAHPEVTFVSS